MEQHAQGLRQNRLLAGEVALLGTAFALRVFDLTKQSLWPDEFINVDASRWPLGQIWTQLVGDKVPALALLLKPWQAAAGSSPFSLRFPSVIFGTLLVALGFLLARRLLGRSAGLAAGVLLALSPFQIYYAQEATAYSLLGALSLLTSWIFLRWRARPGRRVLAGQGVVYALLLYTHYVGVFVPLSHAAFAGVSWLGRRAPPDRRNRDFPQSLPPVSRQWIAAWALGAALFLPWAVTHLPQIGSNLAGGTTRPLRQLLGLTLVDVSFGNALTSHLDAGRAAEAAELRNLMLAGLVLLPILAVALLPQRKGGRWFWSEAQWFVGLQASVPLVLLFVLVQVTRDYVSRYAEPAFVWMPVAAVAGLLRLRWPAGQRRGGLAGSGLKSRSRKGELIPPSYSWTSVQSPAYRLDKAIGGLGFLIIVGYSIWGCLIYFENPGFFRLDFRTAANEILQNWQPGDAVVVTAPYAASTFNYYSAQGHSDVQAVPLPATMPADASDTDPTLTALAARSTRVWHLRWQDDYADPHGVIERWLAAHAIRERDDKLPGNIAVDLWLIQAPLLNALPQAARPADDRLGDVIALAGYDVERPAANTLAVTFYWRLSAPLADDYTLFLHLLAPDGSQLAQADARPYDGQYWTPRWPVGPLIRDPHRVPLDPCLTAGAYNLNLGWYVLKTMQRLGAPGADSLTLSIALPAPPPAAGVGSLLRRLPTPLQLDDRLPNYPGDFCVR